MDMMIPSPEDVLEAAQRYARAAARIAGENIPSILFGRKAELLRIYEGALVDAYITAFAEAIGAAAGDGKINPLPWLDEPENPNNPVALHQYRERISSAIFRREP